MRMIEIIPSEVHMKNQELAWHADVFKQLTKYDVEEGGD